MIIVFIFILLLISWGFWYASHSIYTDKNQELQEGLLKTRENLAVIEERLQKRNNEYNELSKVVDELQKQLEDEAQRNAAVVSQRISSEVRLGAISENVAPFLKEFKHNPKDARFLGTPIDFVCFSLTDDPSITFVEIKTGGSTESKRQKLIKRAIKEGRVYYELMKITDKGVKVE